MSGVASVRNWPIAVEPTSSGDWISVAGGSVLGTSPGTVGSAFQPKRSAASTSASAPSSTPSGANTELHEWAKLSRKRPAAELAVGVLELDAVDDRRALHRELGARVHDARLERRRGGHDLEGRARRLGGREGDPGQRPDLPVAGVERGDAAEAPGQRRSRPPPGGACRSWCAPARGPRAAARASTRSPGQQLARPGARPGGPRTRARARSGPPASRAGSRARRGRVRSSRGLLRLERPGDRPGDRLQRRAARVRRALGEDLAVARQQRARARAARCGGAAPRPGAARERRAAAPRSRRPRRHREHAGRRARCRRPACARRSARRPSRPARRPGRPPRSRWRWRWPRRRDRRARTRAANGPGATRRRAARTSPGSRRAPRRPAKSAAVCSAPEGAADPNAIPAASETTASPPSAGSARWVRRRRRSLDRSPARGPAFTCWASAHYLASGA